MASQFKWPVYIIGISGGSWSVIEPLIASGRIPNIERLICNGASGTVESIRVKGDKHFRPQTAWPTIASGLRPEKHGVTRFFDDARDIKANMIWDVFQEQGAKVGLFGWPITWPPKPIDGFMVPSHLARDSQTWPSELSFIKMLDREGQSAERNSGNQSQGSTKQNRLKIVKSLLKTGLRPSSAMRIATTAARAIVTGDVEKRAILLRHAKLELNSDIFLSLVKQYQTDFSAFTTFLVDLISHRYWRYRDPDLFPNTDEESVIHFHDAIDKAYEHVDRIVGRVVAAAPGKSIIAIVSEHGMSAEPISAEIGKSRYIIQGDKVLEIVGLSSTIIACPVARWIAFRFQPNRDTQSNLAAKLGRILVKDTLLPLFQVHLHQDDEVIAKFNLHSDNEFYAKNGIDNLTLTYNDREFPISYIAKPLGSQRSAMHDDQALMILTGPGISAGKKIFDASILDFMPTILHAAGISVPSGLDGKVLDIFD